MRIYRILVIGDTHIPDRASNIDPKIKSDIESEKPYDIVVFTGDFTSEEIVRWVESLGNRAYYVQGNMDYLDLPKTQKFTLAGIKMGVHHGDGVYPRGNIAQLTEIARSLGVNILFSGHTHSPFIKLSSGRDVLHVNPGSLTGVWGGGGGLMVPTYIKAFLRDNELELRVFILRNNNIALYEKHVYRWNGSTWSLASS